MRVCVLTSLGRSKVSEVGVDLEEEDTCCSMGQTVKLLKILKCLFVLNCLAIGPAAGIVLYHLFFF
jgi:hypothetical protein